MEVSIEERDQVLDFLLEQGTETVRRVKAGEDYEAADLVEIGFDFLEQGLSVALPASTRAWVDMLLPLARGPVLSGVEAAVAKAREGERLDRRIQRALTCAQEHREAADALRASEKVEIFEKTRIKRHLRREAKLLDRAEKLAKFRVPSEGSGEA